MIGFILGCFVGFCFSLMVVAILAAAHEDE